MKKDEAAALGILAVLIGVVVVLSSGDAKASGQATFVPPDPDPDPDPDPVPAVVVPEEPPPTIPPIIFKPATINDPVPAVVVPEEPPPEPPPEDVPPVFITSTEPFFPSARNCANSGLPFNLHQGQGDDAGAAHVAAAFTALGFPVSTLDIQKADKVRSPNRRLWNAPVGKKRSDMIKFAQTTFRSRALPGHFNGPDDDIDGIPGECTLGDLTVAIARLNSGNWPAP